MTHKEKILQFAEYLGINKTQFCKRCGLSNGYLDTKGSITSDKLVLILENFKNLNVDWLLFDKGEMTLSEEKAIEDKGQEISLFGLNDRVTALEENLSEKAVESNSDPNILNALNQINESLKIINKTLIDNSKERD